MGLAGTKNKKKWAKDPNNTAWSRNTDTFGQKILRSQGWAPGQYLGAENASHSEYYGAANASHIRAVLKDDSLGLGAKRNQGDECTGLDALQDLLSRLNGKSDEALGEEQRKRQDLKINKYLNRKLGMVNFVYGGLLVGDKVQELADSMKDKHQDAAQVPGGSEETAGESSEAGKKEKKSKKRKAEDAEGVSSESKKEKKSKKSKSEDADEDSKSKRKDKKDKKRRKDKDASDKEEDSSPDDEDASERKKARKEKKEKRRKAKLENDDQDAPDASDPKPKKSKRRKADKDEQPTPQTTGPSTPPASGTSTPSIQTRHLARSRFIAQKRAAVMDQAALNQIFMIKT